MKHTLKNKLEAPENKIETRKSIRKSGSSAFSLIDSECRLYLIFLQKL